MGLAAGMVLYASCLPVGYLYNLDPGGVNSYMYIIYIYTCVLVCVCVFVIVIFYFSTLNSKAQIKSDVAWITMLHLRLGKCLSIYDTY